MRTIGEETMPRVAVGLLALLELLAWAPGPQPNLDFEQGLRGWTASGDAFDPSASDSNALETSDQVVPAALIKLGGDYWRGVRYPLAGAGTHLVRSTDAGQGTLTSDDLTLDASRRYFSVLVGGARDLQHERIELQVRTSNQSIGIGRDGDYAVVAHFTGLNVDRLHQETALIPENLRGQPTRIKIVDGSSQPGEHILADGMQFTSDEPVAVRAPVWGFADIHTHPMNYMAFGALQNPQIRTVWGVPGRSFSDYEIDPHLVSKDIPKCTTGHGGGPSAELFIDAVEGRFISTGKTINDLTALLKVKLDGHDSHGGPSFNSFPSFQAGLHYQMHITQIHRAWEGGLRLMVAIAVNNKGVEFLMSKPSITSLTPDRDVLGAQVCGITQLANANNDWMEIAYSPEDARRIIEQNKLAIVLGIEMDQLGQLLDNRDPRQQDVSTAFDREIDYLWNIGIRQVTPIHAIDNLLGGAAVFEPVYNWLNDFVHRGKEIVSEEELQYFPPRFFEVREGGCDKGPLSGQFGECVTYRLDATQSRPALVKSPKTLGHLAPFFSDINVPAYYGVAGMMNVRGLSAEGKDYIRRLMQKGMIVGIEHMSQQSVDDVYGVLGNLLATQGHSECEGFGLKPVPASCDEAAYPVAMSHAHFRALSVADRSRTTVEGFRPTEYEASNREADLMRRTNGIVGQFVSEDPVIPPSGVTLPPGLQNDCGGSSKSFAVSLFYALRMLGGGHVALATDFTIISGAAPRFGKYACYAYHSALKPDDERKLMSDQYAISAQKDAVRYTYYDTRLPDGLKNELLGQNKPLTAYQMDDRKWPFDINVDGFAHYGLLPDLLQDAKNSGLPQGTFDALFSSAEAYLQTWEKVGRVMKVTFPPKGDIKLPDCQTVCHDLCPDSPRAGAPPTK
jgi:microsomal dipeptidase-like Zn-dependent dipeptidase